MILCILDSPIWGCPSEGKLSGSPPHSFCSSLSFACEGPLFFFWEDKGQPSNWRQLNLAFRWSNWVQAGSKSDSFFRGNTTCGCPRVKREEAREGLLKRCILSNLAIRKLNLLNKYRVFLTYIDVPEFLLQVNVGNGEKNKIDKNYRNPQKNIRLFIHSILAANNC